ncbi:MAG: GNAT family N-acetyltransferase [Clostridium sp.]
MNIIIRNEVQEDYRKVLEVTREAFFNLYFPGCNEHMVIHNMRSHPDFIKELSFVIEVDGEIIGSIFYTHSKIISKDNTIHKTITFGPVSILPSFHRKGFGYKLISHSIKKAKELGFTAILTLGYPYHYEPYGFVSGKKYGISMEDGKFYKGLLVLPLYEGALNNVNGYVEFADLFDPTEDEVNEFDKSFPEKIKGFKESQKEFEESVSMLDE